MRYGIARMWVTGLLVVTAVTGCTWQGQQQWYKGNLHTHSYWSDGDDYPEMIMKWYKDHGYDFVALSDHNTLAEGEQWVEFEPGGEKEGAFREYLDTFGEEWVRYRESDSLVQVQLKTLEEYRTLFEEPGSFLILQSQEITDRYENKPIHVNATNIREKIDPQGGGSVAEVMQNNIDAVLEQRRRTGEPIVPHLNHPNFGWAVTADDMKQLEGEQFFEVYNGHPAVHNYGDSLHKSTGQIWDEVNTYNILSGKRVLYGLAVDDAHNYHTRDSEHSNPGRGWIQVRSEANTPEAIIAALEQGNFYATTGVAVENISMNSDSLTIEINPGEGVRYKTQFIGTLTYAPEVPGVVLQEKEGLNPSYVFTGDELYVRAKIISDKPKENPYAEGETETAWIQPVLPG